MIEKLHNRRDFNKLKVLYNLQMGKQLMLYFIT